MASDVLMNKFSVLGLVTFLQILPLMIHVIIYLNGSDPIGAHFPLRPLEIESDISLLRGLAWERRKNHDTYIEVMFVLHCIV